MIARSDAALSLRSALLSAILLVFSTSTQGGLAMETSEDIDTNRPSFMFSPLVVPRGSIQLENGTLDKHVPHGINSFDGSETQVRIGLTKGTEFQMFVPNFVLTHQEHSNTSAGVSDLGEVGIKHQFPRLGKLQVTFVGGVNIPTGSTLISGRGVQPVFRIPWAYSLTKNWSIMGMQSLLLLDSGRTVQYVPDFMVSRSLGRKSSAFAEYVGVFPHDLPRLNIIHFGGVYKLNRHNQVDMHFGFGLNASSPSAFVGAGYSYRFDGLAWGGSKP